MKSSGAITLELDDMKLAVSELKAQLADFPLGEHTVGLLFCDSMVEHDELLLELSTAFPFEIAGITSMGTLSSREGFQEACISLTVMTGDDCDFQVVLSDPFTPDHAEEAVSRAYREGVAALDGEPRLIIAYPAYRHDVIMDIYPEILGRVSGGVPVFGGLPSRHMEGGVNAVMARGACYTDRLLTILVGGNVRPVLSVKSLAGDLALQKRTITEARGNTIHRVGDTTFVEFLQGLGLTVRDYDFEDGTYTYFTNPLLLELPGEDGESFVRTLHGLDVKQGTGSIIGNVPLGATVSVGTMTRQVIQDTARDCIDEINAKMKCHETDGYRYSTVLCTSCMVRHMIMSPDSDMESKVLNESLGRGQVLSGYYAYGELGPAGEKDGAAVNRAHNQSIVLCAL